MPDISMCKNAECPSSRYCYRFRARPNIVKQEYREFKVIPGSIVCKDFLSIRQWKTTFKGWKNGRRGKKVHPEKSEIS